MVLLHVDDEDAVRRMVTRMLAGRGIVVLSAGGVAEAERLLTNHEIDAALIDVWLPDGSGFEVYAWIQQHRPSLKPNVAFATGDLVPEAATKGLGAIGRPVLAKPFALQDLLKLVEGWTRA